MYLSLRGDVTEGTRVEHARALKYLAEHFGGDQLINKIRPLDARRVHQLVSEAQASRPLPGPGHREQDGPRVS